MSFRELMSSFKEELEKGFEDRNLDPYVNNLKEVDSAEFFCTSAGLWFGPYMQSPGVFLDMSISHIPRKVFKYIQEGNDNSRMEGGHLKVYDNGTCYLITQDRIDYKAENKPDNHYGWYPRFFIFETCAHAYDRKNIGRCYNRYTCSICGHTYSIDSSD